MVSEAVLQAETRPFPTEQLVQTTQADCESLGLDLAEHSEHALVPPTLTALAPHSTQTVTAVVALCFNS